MQTIYTQRQITGSFILLNIIKDLMNNSRPRVEPKIKTIPQKTEDFFKTVQAGDITLFDNFVEAIAMFGFTRVGKTSTCHVLCGSTLKAETREGQLIYYPSTQKFNNARVGITTQSQTQIPNIFETMVKDTTQKPPHPFKKVWILDQPGYGDTYGFHRIFSNGYFHYRTFSKTPKLKFILAIVMDDLRGTAQKFKKTIFNFINSFNNWDNIKGKIFKATSFLITKADNQITTDGLIQIIRTLRDQAIGGMGANQKQRYQQIITEMIDSKKVFFIQKPTKINQLTVDNTILQQIYDKTQFWDRQVNKNFVDMKDINFSVSKQILGKLRDKDQQLFKEEFQHFMQHMQERAYGMILNHEGSLQNIVKILQVDAVSSIDSHMFLDAMTLFNGTYYKFFENFKQKRDRTLVNLFKNNQNIEVIAQAQLKQLRSIYFIKKFNALSYLFQINDKMQQINIVHIERTIEQLQDFSYNFMLIFRKLSTLKVNRNDNQNIIYKYSYIIQRLIQQSKILNLILFQNQDIRHQFHRLQVKTMSQDIFRILYDKFFTLVIGEININQLKANFIQNIQFQQLVSVNDEIISFFESLEYKSAEIQFKIANMIVQYGNQLFKNEKAPKQDQKIFAIKKLYLYRNKFYAFWNNLKAQSASKSSQQRCVQTIVNLTKSLANILQSKYMFKDARQCYHSINDANNLFKVYQMEEQNAVKDRKRHRQLLIRYGQQSEMFFRKELALQCYQKAYSLSENYKQMKDISNLIIGLNMQKFYSSNAQKKQGEQYLQRFYNEEFCNDFSQQLRTNISTLCEID